jgi:hypothetical protein
MGGRVLFLHDVHAAIGEHEIDLDDAVRDVYAPTVADDDARLAWYLYSTHGAGDGYIVSVITAVRDGAAWERLSRRLRYGDLADWLLDVDRFTYWSQSRLLVATDWSPTADLDFDSLPADAVEHDVRVFREDTIAGPAIEGAISAPKRAAGDVMECIAGFRPFFAPANEAREVTVLYRVISADALESAYVTDTGWDDWKGSLTPRLPVGAHGTTRMLRNVPWSPLA